VLRAVRFVMKRGDGLKSHRNCEPAIAAFISLMRYSKYTVAAVSLRMTQDKRCYGLYRLLFFFIRKH
jgi:hypothetical protein